jgi:hypothetical protein
VQPLQVGPWLTGLAFSASILPQPQLWSLTLTHIGCACTCDSAVQDHRTQRLLMCWTVAARQLLHLKAHISNSLVAKAHSRRTCFAQYQSVSLLGHPYSVEQVLMLASCRQPISLSTCANRLLLLAGLRATAARPARWRTTQHTGRSARASALGTASRARLHVELLAPQYYINGPCPSTSTQQQKFFSTWSGGPNQQPACGSCGGQREAYRLTLTPSVALGQPGGHVAPAKPWFVGPGRAARVLALPQ